MRGFLFSDSQKTPTDMKQQAQTQLKNRYPSLGQPLASYMHHVDKLSADAKGHIHAEALRHLEPTGEVITDAQALENIVQEHAALHRLILDFVTYAAPQVGSVGDLICAIDEDDLRLVDANEDTSLVQFRFGVLTALQDPEVTQSVEALRSRIGALGIALGFWKVA